MDSYRPPARRWDDGPPPMPNNVRENMYHFRGSANDAPHPRGPQYPARRGNSGHPGRRPLGMSRRPLFRLPADLGDRRIASDPTAQDKFRNSDDVTDSEEDEMAESDEDITDMPATKRTKYDQSADATKSTPKWSNPDPYTALPPPTETTGKRTDVVKLIRKAKISDVKKDDSDTENTRNEDFISFDLGPDEMFPSPSPPPDAPTGPRSDVRGSGHDNLGKRKRGYDEAQPRRSRTSDFGNVMVLREWQASPYANSTPWLRHVRSDNLPSVALHKEIVDFYTWVQPTEHEEHVRDDVLKRLNLAFNRIEPGELKAFGSYAAGLYLPIGDMDLVYLQRSYRPGRVGYNGLPPPPTKTLLHRFANYLRTQNIAKPSTVQMIPSAKVPIIKFVERVSGLKIDLSFNNDSGIVANETFQKWKEAYPTMPILVSVIKQYLMIRGLNDVSIGGLGGFSIICLVTSLIQHMPMTTSPPNLGELLVEFFNLYGNLLDKESVAIRLDPPGYIDKESYQPFLFNTDKKNRLTIIDPNRPENNISGGSHEINRIVACFSSAHDILHDNMSIYSKSAQQHVSFSFLKDLVGGDFTAYDVQRTILRDLYFGLTGKEAPAVIPPPPPPISDHIAPPPPPSQKMSLPKTTNGTANNVSKKPLVKGERRAQRLKLARPELAKKVGNSISSANAIKLGGYENADIMEKDLKERLDAQA